MEFLFAGGAAGIEEFGDVPVEVGAWGDDVAVHRPVVVFTEGKAVGGVVIAELVPRKEMSGVDERDVVAGGQFDAEAAGGALVVVDGENLAAEGGTAAVFEGLVGDEGWLKVES